MSQENFRGHSVIEKGVGCCFFINKYKKKKRRRKTLYLVISEKKKQRRRKKKRGTSFCPFIELTTHVRENFPT